ncbi:MAG: hypothetical protein QXF46_01445 [Thermofilaceae archaeon]
MTGGPKLLVSTERGKEKRVARDLMDALYPHDRGVKLELIEGGIVVYSSLGHDHLIDLLQQYPVRGLLRVRRVLASAEGSLEAAVDELLAQAARLGVKLRNVEARTGGLLDRRKLEELIALRARQLNLTDRNGVRARTVLLRRDEGNWLLLLAV